MVHTDTEAEKARVYQAMQEPDSTPAYYFLDASGGLVAVLAGMISEDQVRELVEPPARP